MNRNNVTDIKLHHLLYYFVFYSFIGWCLEAVYVSAQSGRFINRGFMGSPLCPIYGFGALIVIICLYRVKDRILMLFTGAVLLLSTLEYTTSFVMEKYFGMVKWDYSSQFLNIKGRICLKYSLMWGALAVIAITYIQPAFHNFICNMPTSYRAVISFSLILYIAINCAAAILSMVELKPEAVGEKQAGFEASDFPIYVENMTVKSIGQLCGKAPETKLPELFYITFIN